jgi:hypothetical protein
MRILKSIFWNRKSGKECLKEGKNTTENDMEDIVPPVRGYRSMLSTRAVKLQNLKKGDNNR